MGRYRFTAARRRALRKARRRWTGMGPTARRKAMPGRRKGTFKRLPVGSYVMKDIGRPKHHYQFIKKTKYGWKKVKAPQRLLGAGWKREGKGYVRRPR